MKVNITEEERNYILEMHHLNEQRGVNAPLRRDVVDGIIRGYNQLGDSYQGFLNNDNNNFYYVFTNISEQGRLRFSIYEPIFFSNVDIYGFSILPVGGVSINPDDRKGIIETYSHPSAVRDVSKQNIPNGLNVANLVEYVRNYSQNNSEFNRLLVRMESNKENVIRMANKSENRKLSQFYNLLLNS